MPLFKIIENSQASLNPSDLPRANGGVLLFARFFNLAVRVPIPPLDSNGYLPPGIRECTLPEIEAAFATSIHRGKLFDGLVRYADLLRSCGVLRFLYVNGSFTTSKADPGDVDVVVEYPPAAMFRPLATFFTQVGQVDANKKKFYVHPMFVPYNNEAGCVAYFQSIRVDESLAKKLPPSFRKGLLRVTL